MIANELGNKEAKKLMIEFADRTLATGSRKLPEIGKIMFLGVVFKARRVMTR